MRKMLTVPDLAVPKQQAGAALPRDKGEPVFAKPWQAHAFAVVMSLYRDGHYDWAEWDDYLGEEIQAPGHSSGDVDDQPAPDADNRGANFSRFLEACEEDGTSYYHYWLTATEKLLDATGLVPKAQLEARIAAFQKAENTPPRFTAGQKVMVRNIKREGHTHLPLYLRGVPGEVANLRGLYVFPEATGHSHGHDHGGHDHDRGELDTLQHVYNVRFQAADIWGPEKGSHSLNFNLWDYQLDPA